MITPSELCKEMEGKVAVKELVEAEEKPPLTCDNNITDASRKNDVVSFSFEKASIPS